MIISHLKKIFLCDLHYREEILANHLVVRNFKNKMYISPFYYFFILKLFSMCEIQQHICVCKYSNYCVRMCKYVQI